MLPRGLGGQSGRLSGPGGPRFPGGRQWTSQERLVRVSVVTGTRNRLPRAWVGPVRLAAAFPLPLLVGLSRQASGPRPCDGPRRRHLDACQTSPRGCVPPAGRARRTVRKGRPHQGRAPADSHPTRMTCRGVREVFTASLPTPDAYTSGERGSATPGPTGVPHRALGLPQGASYRVPPAFGRSGSPRASGLTGRRRHAPCGYALAPTQTPGASAPGVDQARLGPAVLPPAPFRAVRSTGSRRKVRPAPHRRKPCCASRGRLPQAFRQGPQCGPPLMRHHARGFQTLPTRTFRPDEDDARPTPSPARLSRVLPGGSGLPDAPVRRRRAARAGRRVLDCLALASFLVVAWTASTSGTLTAGRPAAASPLASVPRHRRCRSLFARRQAARTLAS